MKTLPSKGKPQKFDNPVVACPSAPGDGYQFGFPDLPVSCYQWDAVDDTGCGDQFVREIAFEIQCGGLFADGQIQWPNLHPGKDPDELGRSDIYRNPAQLRQLGNLPQHDCRYAPWFRGQ